MVLAYLEVSRKGREALRKERKDPILTPCVLMIELWVEVSGGYGEVS